jgi:hypothetical protein
VGERIAINDKQRLSQANIAELGVSLINASSMPSQFA